MVERDSARSPLSPTASDWVVGSPPGFDSPSADVPWTSSFLDLSEPERRIALHDLAPDADGGLALSSLALAGPFRVLSEEGASRLRSIANELEPSARGDERVRRHRGLVYRSTFLRGLAADPMLLAHLSRLAGVDLAPHPVSHHSMQLNYPPLEVGKRIDAWHPDVVAYALVVMVSDPAAIDGGEFQWFDGSVEEGSALLAGGGLPAERVRTVDFPAAGWGFVMQGHRLLHRAAPLRRAGERVTLVGSYWAPGAPRPDPGELATIRRADGNEVALREWARFRAVEAAARLLAFAERDTGFELPVAEVRARLASALAGAAAAVEELAVDEPGRFIVLDRD